MPEFTNTRESGLEAIADCKRITVTTIEKFPYIVPQIGADHKDNRFAIIIDEVHSGQSGRNSAQMNLALSGLISNDDFGDVRHSLSRWRED